MMARTWNRCTGWALGLILAGLALRALALPVEGIYVVVSSQSAVRSLSQQDLLALYTGRTRALPTGEVVTPLDQQRDGAGRADFYQALTGMDIARINSYWARLHFTGQVQPPQSAGDDAAMVQRLRADRSAIGYLTREPQDGSVRVLMRLP
jgi:hypothetical protein